MLRNAPNPWGDAGLAGRLVGGGWNYDAPYASPVTNLRLTTDSSVLSRHTVEGLKPAIAPESLTAVHVDARATVTVAEAGQA